MDLSFLYYAVLTLFVIINPIGTIGIIRSLLEDYSKKDRKRIIHKAIVVATSSLLVFTIFGNAIFGFLDISLYSFKIAGGILLGMISLQMIFGQKQKTKHTSEEENEWETMENLAITPLAIPLMTGPGAITTGILLYSSAVSAEQKIFVILAVVIACMLAYVIFRSSDRIFSILGTTGTKVITRLMGLILLAIAVQYVTGGIYDFYLTFV
ncbi:MAG: NAAT family transporter [Candidatus Aenigmarchaeota archaeon]|nr:NAAT family transporter [Candidatus Aenigmarchaeota archaeon]